MYKRQPHNGSLGGLTGADAQCMEAAKGLLPGTWRAWLSTSTVDAAQRVLDVPYYRLDGRRIARNRAALTNAATTPLENALNIDENGRTSQFAQVWTGTDATGKATATTCINWASVDTTGMAGNPSSTGAAWTEQRADSCTASVALYCFQVSTQ